MEASKLEVLLAIAASEFNRTTHVHFMPAGKSFVSMLRYMRSTGCIEPLSESYYRLTKKGWKYLRRHQKDRFRDVDKQIDSFVDGLK
jgi:DNA-binding PadR family transcriptional regulator